MTFRLSPDIELPGNAATSTFAFLGTRGTGKSYGAGVLTESMLAAGVQIVVVDPVGLWYGLRIAADGKGRGFDVPVFGGIHGDIPLEPTAGELVAHLVVERGLSLVLDVSDFTDGQQRRFVEAFSRTFFQLKKRNKSPVHLIFEEAHEFFPQVVDGASAPMVGATKRPWKVGRNYGIGGTLISTRTAEINKNALNISDYIVTGRLTAPDDVKRIKDWASSNGVNAEQAAALATLPKGRLIVWRDPSAGGAVVTTFRKKTTFDTSRTPEAGDAQAPRGLPSVDLVAIRADMAATIEEAKANDPKMLREEIARLRAELATAPGRSDMVARISQDAVALAAERDQVRCDLAAFEGATPAEMRRLRAMELHFDPIVNAVDAYRAEGGGRWARPAPTPPVNGRPITNMRPLTKGEAEDSERPLRVSDFQPPPRAVSATPRAADRGGLTKCPREILAALAARHPTTLTKVQLATLAGYAPSGGGFNNAMGELKGKELIERDGDSFAITAAGLKVTPRGQAPRTPAELVDFWCSKLTGRARDMLRLLSRARQPLTKEQIAHEVGMEVSAGGFNNYLGTLRSNGLVQKTRGGFEAASSLVLR